MPTISVIIPFYNRSAWLIEAVASVLSQTYTDFEVIIVNDGSSEALNPHDVFVDERIRYLEQENRGAAAARNTGINLAKGKYIAFLDADDLFLPSKLETQVKCMEMNPDVALSHTSYMRMTDDGDYIEEEDSGQFSGEVYPRIITFCPIATPTVMVRHEVLNSLRFEEEVCVGEDIMLWLRIARISNILGIREPLSKVRMHGANAELNPDIQLVSNIKIVNYAIEYDAGLNKLFRLKAISGIYLRIGYLKFNLKEKYQAICCVSKAIVYWPVNIIGYLLLLYFMLPEVLQKALRRYCNVKSK